MAASTAIPYSLSVRTNAPNRRGGKSQSPSSAYASTSAPAPLSAFPLAIAPAPPSFARKSRNRDSMLARRFLWIIRSEEHTSELQSLMRISYAVFCLKKKKKKKKQQQN